MAEGGARSIAFDATPLLGQPTGVGRFCAGALAGLARRSDVAVAAFAVSWRRRRGIDRRVPPGVSTRQRPMPARPLHLAWRHGSLPPVEWFVGRHDVVHGSNFVVPPTRSARRVVTVHDLTVVRYPELCAAPTLVFPALVRRALSEGAWVHTPSQFVADEVVEHFGADPERVRAVHHGVPLAGSSSPAPQDGPREEGRRDRPAIVLPPGCDRIVLAVGTIEPRKDYPLLVAAFERIAPVYRDVALVIVGGRGWGAAALDDVVEASPAASRILRPGYLEDPAVDALLSGATMLAFPSRYEGFGFPPLQAMAAGVPVVATAAGAVPEVAGDGALLVPTGDADALASAMARVLDGGPAVDSLVERGRRRSREFSWDRCAAGLAALYRDALLDAGAGVGRG